jgi:hypothetical protein
MISKFQVATEGFSWRPSDLNSSKLPHCYEGHWIDFQIITLTFINTKVQIQALSTSIFY